jgi:hypothetical protein
MTTTTSPTRLPRASAMRGTTTVSGSSMLRGLRPSWKARTTAGPKASFME